MAKLEMTRVRSRAWEAVSARQTVITVTTRVTPLVLL